MYKVPLTPESQPDESPKRSNTHSRGRQGNHKSQSPPKRNDSMPRGADTRRPGGYGGFAAVSDLPPRTDSTAPAHSDDFMQRMNNLSPPKPLGLDRRGGAARHMFPQRKDSLDRWEPPEDDGPTPRQNGNTTFGLPADIKPPNRADTFPRQAAPSDNHRRPSEPGYSSERPKQDPVHRHAQRPSTSSGPVTSRRPPPRTDLIPKHKNSGSVDLVAEFGTSNPYHTPTASASSGYSSGALSESASSTFTSPARSQSSRRPSEAAYTGRAALPPLPRPELRVDSSVQNQYRFQGAGLMVESPFSASPQDSFPRRDQYGAGPRAPVQYGGSLPPDVPYPTPPPALRGQSSSPMRNRTATPSRGDCKACAMPITGKSISSVDGRLTGKYHKACFVCTTCTEPFASAEFYILNNKPYCGDHYHELNGSLCGTCRTGIEGQYVADETNAKHHVKCFRCLDCGQSLSDGYYEVNGQAYCERDAFRRVQSANNSHSSGMDAPPPVPPVPAEHLPQSQQQQEQYSPPTQHSHALPAPEFGLNGRRPSNSKAPRAGVGLGMMERGPYGVSPGSKMQMQMNKRMTRIGMM